MKEKHLKKGIKKRLLSIVLTLARVLVVMPGMPLTVHALDDRYSEVQIGGEVFLYDTQQFIESTSTSFICNEHREIAKKNDEHEDTYHNIFTMEAFERCKQAGHVGRKCTVSFNMHGHGETIENWVCKEGYILGIPNVEPTDDWVFAGWYENENFDGQSWDIDRRVDYDITLHAKWVQISHTWTYSVGSGADSNKLIATCDGDSCSSSSHSVSLTLTASDANYSGSAVEATMDTTAT